jgi:uncharacterized membrane-anchored protein
MKSLSPSFTNFLNKVPQITMYFWIIKVLCTTVWETAADFLNINLHFGLTGTSVVTGMLLAAFLFIQFRSKKYVPSIYWLNVVLISVFGTLITDNLTDVMGIPLEVSTIFFSVLLGIIFLIWYIKEKTLSVHKIDSPRRETFYWSAILCTFALGTASGDLIAEGLWFGYLTTGIIIAVAIAILSIAWKKWLNAILSFWLIYILTRPLGASLWDFLSQPSNHGWLWLWATMTSFIFLSAIWATIYYLTITKKDVIAEIQKAHNQSLIKWSSVRQTMITISAIIIISLVWYYRRSNILQQNTSWDNGSVVMQNIQTLGDLSVFRQITQDTLDLVSKNELQDATIRIKDLEYERDNAQAVLKAKDKVQRTEIDDRIDIVLKALRASTVDPVKSKSSLELLLVVLQ